ncbi:hypothetical protein ACVWYF_001439 [Hymenobacter sp. UYAg731]
MMKKRLLWACILSLAVLVAGTPVLAQSTPTITDLHTPTAPGFVLLGIEPTSIDKPTTPSAFATSLQSAITATGVRPGYSMEVAPYWLVSRPSLTLDEYRNPTVRQNISQTFSLSFATSSLAKVGTGMGIGARVQLFSGHIPPDKLADSNARKCLEIFARDGVRNEISVAVVDNETDTDALTGTLPLTDNDIVTKHDSLRRAVARHIRLRITKNRPAIQANIKSSSTCSALSDDDLARVITQYMEVCIQDLTIQYAGPIATRADLRAWVNHLKDETIANKVVQQVITNEVSLDKNRSGFLWDFAAATVLAFPESTWGNSSFQRWGAWTTIGYDTGDLDLLAVGRFLNPVGTPDSARTLDVGIKLNYGTSTSKFKIGGEVLFRQYRRDKTIDAGSGFFEVHKLRKNTERFDVNINYKFSDTISITSTIGKNFNEMFVNTNNLLTIFGIQYNVASYSAKP